ncbi:MAG: glycosyltransferase family 4 protein [Candidatus Omnitrophota bacterium]
MKILFLTTHFNTGGITNYIMTLSSQMVRDGHHVIVVSSGGNCVEGLEGPGTRHVEMSIRTKSVFSPKLIRAAFRIKQLIRDENIEIIHANTRVTQWLACLVSSMTGVPYVSTCHGFFRPRFFRKIFPCWGKKVIAISDQVGEHLTKDFGVDSGRVAVIRNGIDLDRFSPVTKDARRALQMKAGFDGVKIIGIVARLADVKGHHILIDAVRIMRGSIPRIRLLIVGEGKEETRLRRQVEKLGLSDIVLFQPIVNRTSEILQLLDCFVSPSLKEGLGLSVMEAQASGLPVVASRTGGIPSLIEDGITGVLVEPGNVDMLVDKMITVLNDDEFCDALARNARQKAEREYGAEMMAEKTMEVYQSLGSRNRELKNSKREMRNSKEI